MRSTIHRMVLLAFVLITAGTTVGRAGTDSGDVTAGAAIFKTNCVLCHGPAGHGDA